MCHVVIPFVLDDFLLQPQVAVYYESVQMVSGRNAFLERFFGTLFGNAFLMSGVWSWSGGGRGVFVGFSTR